MTPTESERGRRRTSSPSFDQVIVVDWSAHSAPKRGADSIWICRRRAGGRPDTTNVATRAQAVDLLADLIRGGGRCLLAVDFSLGYPAGTAQAFGLRGRPWTATWALLGDAVVDDDRNRNNRFAVASDLNARAGSGPGPFWGCPPAARTSTLTSTKVPPDPLPTWRCAEFRLGASGRRPFSCWQLLGAGAVGSQTLLGIVALGRLVDRLAADPSFTVDVWPFTTGLRPPSVDAQQVVIAEAWPSMIDLPRRRDDGRTKDEMQVVELSRVLAGLDAEGRLDALFSPDVPATLVDDVVAEEGWLLGAGTGLARG